MSIERWLYVVRLRLRSLFKGRQADADLDEELSGHIALEIERRITAGAMPGTARTETLKSLGGAQQRKEECRDTRGFGLIHEALRNAHFGLQLLRRSPGFAAVAVGLSALGIGVSTAMFTVINGVLLQTVPFPEPNRLVVLSAMPEDFGFSGMLALAEPHYLNVHDRNRSFDKVAAVDSTTPTLTGMGEAANVSVAAVTTDYFDVLRIRAMAGRGIQPGDDAPTTDPVAVLSEAFWTKYFSASPSAIGSRITLDGISRRVIGVMPEELQRFTGSEVWIPLNVRVDPQNFKFLTVIGRLKNGVTTQRARAELELLASPDALPLSKEDLSAAQQMRWTLKVLPLKEQVIRDSRRLLAMFSAAVILVLIIACANVMNLLLARTSDRSHELSVRIALGATRGQIVRQLLTESLLLSMLGGLAGIGLAAAGIRWLVSLAPPSLPRVDDIHINGVVLVFAVGLSCVTGIAFGLLPAVRASRRHAGSMAAPRTASAPREHARAVLTVVEIALSLILLIGAGLLLRSFVNLRSVNPGFNPTGLVAMSVRLPARSYAEAARITNLQDAVLERLRAIPGVTEAAAVNYLPLAGNSFTSNVTTETRAMPRDYMAGVAAVSPSYFGTMGIRLLRGHDFSPSERSQHQIIVSTALAEDLWQSVDIIGKRLSFSDHPGAADWLTVIGVAADVRQQTLDTPPSPLAYQPSWQIADAHRLSYTSFVMRTRSPVESAIPAMRNALHDVAPDQSVTMLMTMEQLMDEITSDRRFQVKLTSIFALAALALSVAGVYGVLAYNVSQRTREFGIRMTLGATGHHLVAVVVRQTLVLACAGTLIGAVGALGVNRLLIGFLFEVTPTDPGTFAIVAAIVLVAALAAAAVPAWRATRVDPTVALRAE